MVAWFIIIFMLLSTVLLIGLNEKDLKYIKLEYNIKYKTYNYLKNNKIKINKTTKIDINELIDEENITEELIEKYCIKNVEIEKRILLNEYNIIKKCE